MDLIQYATTPDLKCLSVISSSQFLALYQCKVADPDPGALVGSSFQKRFGPGCCFQYMFGSGSGLNVKIYNPTESNFPTVFIEVIIQY